MNQTEYNSRVQHDAQWGKSAKHLHEDNVSQISSFTGRSIPLIPDCSSQTSGYSSIGLFAIGNRAFGLGSSP